VLTNVALNSNIMSMIQKYIQLDDVICLIFQALTEKHFETKFAKVNVDKAKFLVERLKIRVLPAVLCFQKGMVVDR